MPREVFGLDAAGDVSSWGHAQAFARAEAAAEFRRGIRLDADVTGQVSAEASLRDTAVGGLEVGAEGNAAVGVQAQVPLDLFGQFGLAMQARIGARASAWVRAEAGLTGEILARLARERLNGPWREVADAVLPRLLVRGGFVARASVAAEAHASLIVAGSLVSSASGGPGFDIVADAGFGWGVGSGYGFVCSIGIDDPERLFDAAAGPIQAAIGEELGRLADSQPSLRPLQAVGSFLLPLGLRVALRAGIALTKAPGPTRDSGIDGLGDQFARGITDLILGAAVDAAVAALLEGMAPLVPGLESDLDENELRRLEAAVTAVTTWGRLLGTFGPHGFWAGPARGVAEGAWDILGVAANRGLNVANSVRDVVAAVWVASALASLRETATWSPPPPSIAAHLRSALGLSAERAFTPGDALGWLLGRAAEIVAAEPALSTVTDLLGSIPATTQRVLLEAGLGLAGLDNAASVVNAIGAPLASLLADRVLPALEQAEATAEPSRAAFLREAVLPALRVLAMLLPDLGQIASVEGQQALVMREKLSVGLLAVIGRVVLAVGEALQSHAMAAGASAARSIADLVEAGDRVDVVHRVVQLWQVANPLMPIPDAPLVSDVFRLAADVVDYWDAGVRPRQYQLAGDLLRDLLALSDPAVAFAALEDPDAAPAPERMNASLVHVGQAIGSLASLAAPRVVAILLSYAGRRALAIVEIAAAAIEAAKRGLDAVIQTGQDLLALAGQLWQQINAELLAIYQQIAALANYFHQSVGAATALIRDSIWNGFIYPALTGNFVYQAWPQLGDIFVNAVRGAYEAAFVAIQWLLQTPLAIVRDAANWMRDLLMAQIDASAVDPARLLSDFGSRCLQVPGTTLQFPIRVEINIGIVLVIDLGTISVGVGSVVGWLRDFVLSILGGGAESVTGRLCSSAAEVVELTHRRTVAIEQAATAAPISADEAARLVTGQPQSVAMSVSRAAGRSVDVDIRVAGANRSFLEPVATIPARVQVQVDGRTLMLPPGAWVDSSGGSLRTRLRLAASRFGLIPVAPFRRPPVELDAGDTTLFVEGGRFHLATAAGTAMTTAPAEPVAVMPIISPAPRVGTIRGARTVPIATEGELLERAAELRRLMSVGSGGVAVPAEAPPPRMVLRAEGMALPIPSEIRGDRLGWLVATEDTVPVVPVECAPGVHSMIVTVADGAGRRAFGSCAVVLTDTAA